MSSLFSDLASLGLKGASSLEVYQKTEEKKTEEKAAKAEVQVKEADLLFDKTYTCPVCDKEFRSKTVRAGKVRLIGADTDLRPKYQGMDSLKYDAVVCPNCGYAALNRFFGYMTDAQAKLIREGISSNFNGLKQEEDCFSYDEAITRHKLALLNAIVKKSKFSERAYTCLKISWLLRGKSETLPSDTENYEKVKEELKEQEMELLGKAYEGFMEAISKEAFPMCGMDINTTYYLVADLARRLDKNDEAMRWISRVLIARDANDRIKSKARELKDMIKEAEGAKK